MPIDPFNRNAYANRQPGAMGKIQGLLSRPGVSEILLGLGQGLLSKSGYSTTPTSTGEAFGAGLLGVQQAQQRMQQKKLQEAENKRADRYTNIAEDTLKLNQFKALQPDIPSQTSAVKNAIALGYEPGSPDFNQYVRAQTEKKGTNVDVRVGGQTQSALDMVKTGAELIGSKPELEGSIDPEGVYTIDPEKGIKKIQDTRLGGEAAGKVAMLQSARGALPALKSFFYNEDGTVNNKNILTAQSIAGFDGVPWTEGRTMRAMWEQGIQGITRLETGAAMPPTEVENTRTRFFPKPWDSDELKVAKLTLMEEFLNGSVSLVKPEDGVPKFDVPGFEKHLARKVKEVRDANKNKGASGTNLEQTIGGKTYIKQNGEWFEKGN